MLFSFYLYKNIFNLTLCFSSEVMQARGQMSRGERAPHRQPVQFFLKVCHRWTHLYHLSFHCLTLIKLSSNLTSHWLFFSFHWPFCFISIMPFNYFCWTTAVSNPSKVKPSWLWKVTILEIIVGRSIAFIILINASSSALRMRKMASF